MSKLFKMLKEKLLALVIAAARDWFKGADKLLDTPEEQLEFGKLFAEAMELGGLTEAQEIAIGRRLALRLNDDALEPLAEYFRTNPDADLTEIPRKLVLQIVKSLGVLSVAVGLEMIDTLIDTEEERVNIAAKIHDSLPKNIPVIPRSIEIALYEAAIQEIREKLFLKLIDKLKRPLPAVKPAV